MGVQEVSDVMEAEREMEDEEKEDEKEDTEEDSEEEHALRRKGKKNSSHQRWSQQEMNEIKMYFGEHLKSKTTPRSNEVEKAKVKSKQNGGQIYLCANHLIIKKISYLNHK